MEQQAPARVTRLRQRLSLEQNEEVSSPATPTKKRASKLAKPQLDNIEENAAVNSPKRATRRSIARVVEPVEDKVLTPGKRSARVKSNSSIVSETTQSFDSPRAKRATRRNSLAGSDNEIVTPVRKSRRISKEFNGSPDTQLESKSVTKRGNKGTAVKAIEEETGDISVTTLNSSLNSEKTSSLSNTSQSTVSKELEKSLLTVTEEPNVLDKSSPNVRKSTRLSLKRNSKSPIIEEDINDKFPKQYIRSETISESTTLSKGNLKSESKEKIGEKVNKSLPAIRDKNDHNKRLRTKSLTNIDKHLAVDSSALFLSDNESRKAKSHKKQKTITGQDVSQNHGMGDYDKENSASSSKLNTTPLKIEENKENEVDVNLSLNSSKQLYASLGAQSKKISNKSLLNISGIDTLDMSIQQNVTEVATETNKEGKKSSKRSSKSSSSYTLPPDCANQSEIHTTIYLDDSDASVIDSEIITTNNEQNFNNSSMTKENTRKHLLSKNEKSIDEVFDQKSEKVNSSIHTECILNQPNPATNESVTVSKKAKIKSATENSYNGSLSNHITNKVDTTNKINDVDVLDNSSSVVWFGKKGRQETDRSCEPMDIDETIPENVTLIDSSHENEPNINQKWDEIEYQIKNFPTKTCFLNNSKLVPSNVDMSEATPSEEKMKNSNENSQELGKSNIASKSTLILSVNNLDKSTDNTSQRSSRSFKSDTPKSKSYDISMNKEISSNKKNHSMSGIGVTPLTNKTLKNFGVFTSTPVNLQSIVLSNDNSQSKNEQSKSSNKSEKSINSAKSDSSEEDDESDFLDDEAKDAGKEYQSGDSQDEEDKEYAERNEIREKGETLDSEEDFSDNSDYEKDSFVVSSDEEDAELLSGSGDDLSISDNELNMSTKAKNKYNKRKIKEQKRASKEMFQARHGINYKPTESEDSDDTEIIITNKNKKQNRLRLDSSKDTTKDEKEISILDNSFLNVKDPLSTILVKQEPTELNATNNTVLEDIENVEVDQDITIFANKDTGNPLMSDSGHDESNTESESSDDGGIANNFDALLKGLNQSKNDKFHGGAKGKINKTLDASDDKKESNDSIVGKLNLTKTKSPKNNKKTKSATEFSVFNEGLSHAKESKQKTDKIESVDPEVNKNVALIKNHHSFMEYETSKKKKENSLFDKLNLTASGKEKKVRKDNEKSKITDKPVEQNENDESSSDAIDFKLLFSHDEDSNDKPDNNKSSSIDEPPVEQFIPLKKSDAKTNLVEIEVKSIGKTYEKEDHDGGGDILQMKLPDDVSNTSGEKSKKKKNKKKNVSDPAQVDSKDTEFVENDETNDKIEVIMSPKPKHLSKSEKKIKKIEKDIQENVELESQQRKTKKRKRDDDETDTVNKIYQTSLESKTIVRRLPASILEKLDNEPKKEMEKCETKPSVITSTSAFRVEETKRRKNKPSLYLEESIHVDANPTFTVNKASIKSLKKPKTMPSVPSASTSIAGFTTNFKVNVLTENRRLDAKLSFGTADFTNFKTELLYGSRIKRIATDELCRKQKKIKSTKF